MGIIVNQAKFVFPAPKPDVIIKTISDTCGLLVDYIDDEHALEVHEFSGTLSLRVAPEIKVEIRAYKQGAVQECHESLGLSDLAATMKPSGYYDKGGVQRIDVEAYWGDEPTLLDLTQATLQRLGGVFREGLKVDESILDHISEAEIVRRIQANAAVHKKRRPIYFLGGLLMAITLPFHVIFFVMGAPFKLMCLRRKHPEIFKQSDRK